MTFENDQQLIDIIERNPNKYLVEFACRQNQRARLHLYGKGIEDYVVAIPGFEKPWMQQLRLKYGMTNVDMFARLLKPKAKVYTARGGNAYYNLGQDGNARAGMMAARIRNGVSVKKWVETVWAPHADDDPMGVIFMEIDSNGYSYPTYKASSTVYDYQSDGGTGFEYIIFRVSNADKQALNLPKDQVVFRVVDDAFDRYVIYKDKKIEAIAGQTFINHYYDVPARYCGFTPNPDLEGGVVSMLHYVFGLADNHLLQAGIKVTVMLKHGFAKYWEYGDDCLKCNGSGKHKGGVCPDCAGVGKQIVIKPGQDKIVEWPSKESGGLVKGNPGGYIEPSKTAYDIITQEIGMLEDKINRTLWGSKSTQKLQPGMGLSGAPNGTITATEVMDNRQPEADSMHTLSDAAESIDKFIMDHAISFNLRQAGYIKRGGCSINYGRRYLMEEPDALLTRYSAARKEGVSPGILFGMYEEYLESKYQADPVSLALHRKLMKVEPFMHYTISEMKLNGATPEDMRKKQYYGEWLTQSDNDLLLSSSVQKLQQSLEAFVSTKPLPVQETTDPKKKPVAA